jgi:hypothetical protein
MVAFFYGWWSSITGTHHPPVGTHPTQNTIYLIRNFPQMGNGYLMRLDNTLIHQRLSQYFN